MALEPCAPLGGHVVVHSWAATSFCECLGVSEPVWHAPTGLVQVLSVHPTLTYVGTSDLMGLVTAQGTTQNGPRMETKNGVLCLERGLGAQGVLTMTAAPAQGLPPLYVSLQ